MENTARNPTSKRKFSITKSDDDQMIVFGWANVSMRIGDELIEDWQEDIIEPDELEAAAYDFVELYREGGEMHERGGVATRIESVVFTKEKMEAMTTLLCLLLKKKSSRCSFFRHFFLILHRKSDVSRDEAANNAIYCLLR